LLFALEPTLLVVCPNLIAFRRPLSPPRLLIVGIKSVSLVHRKSSLRGEMVIHQGLNEGVPRSDIAAARPHLIVAL
jgi:hypothetical protein